LQEKGGKKKKPQPREERIGTPKSPREIVCAKQPPGAAQSEEGGRERAGGRGDKGRPTISRCGEGGQEAAARSLPRCTIQTEQIRRFDAR